MIIRKDINDNIEIVSGISAEGYTVAKGNNGKNYVLKDTVGSDILHAAEGNSKTGKAINFNLPIEYTCLHTCECYTTGACYACGGCYQFAINQAGYTENYNFYKNSSTEVFCNTLQLAINSIGYKLFRYFTIGDIPDYRFIDCMVKLAKDNPDVKFWSYTKKYTLVNIWIKEHGVLPDNLVIIFSHWLNNDGTYFPMDNPYNLPTSEFIPLGKEELKEKVTHVCPCSDPTINATCETCDKPCYSLKHGESMALLEHSTSRTKARDKAIKTEKEKLKKAEKAAKKTSKK